MTKAKQTEEQRLENLLDFMEDKYEKLVWYARKAPADHPYWNGVPDDIKAGALNTASTVEELYPEEIDRLKDPQSSQWQHGFHSGCLAALRLFSEAIAEPEFCPEEGWGEEPVYGGIDNAMSTFPCLDT